MVLIKAVPGATDSLTDITGIQVGHAVDEKVVTGVTVIIPDQSVVMGVDVRGGGPGTRDTDALDPACHVEAFHGLVLSGGSVFGLAAADGVVAGLSEQGVGLALGPRAIPVVPAAILFDLVNDGDKDWGAEAPYRRLGTEALAALSDEVSCGRVGAGFGARAGGRWGGLGTASLFLENGLGVAAIVAVNSFGEVMDGTPTHGHVSLPKLSMIGGNTTIGAVVTNAKLDKAGCKRLAMMAQDGYARTIRPIHTPFDGDSVFAMATGEKQVDDPLHQLMAVLGTLAADCVVKAIEKAVKGG